MATTSEGRKLTQPVIETIERIVRTVLPTHFTESRYVKIKPHPDSTFNPQPLRCIYNALRAGSPLMAGYYASIGDIIDDSIASVVLVAHVWNANWLDTTPPSINEESQWRLLFADSTGVVLRAFATYIMNLMILASDNKLPPLSTPILVLARPDLFGLSVDNDTANLLLPIAKSITRNPRRLKQFNETAAAMAALPNIILYAGVGTSDVRGQIIWKRDDSAKEKRLDLSYRFVLKQMGCCYRCSKVEGLFKCPRCHIALYCSQECQKADWPPHRLTECTSSHRADVGGNNEEMEQRVERLRARPLSSEELAILVPKLKYRTDWALNMARVTPCRTDPPRQLYVIPVPHSRAAWMMKIHSRLTMDEKGLYFYAAFEEMISPSTRNRTPHTWLSIFANVLNNYKIHESIVAYFYDLDTIWIKYCPGRGGGGGTVEEKKKEKKVAVEVR